MNKEDFVTYEQALALRKLGFKEDCLYYYDEYGAIFANSEYSEKEILVDDLLYSYNRKNYRNILCDAPTLAQAHKWLRINKKLYISIFFEARSIIWYALVININKPKIVGHTENYNSYEEALSTGITECIKLLEND